MKCVNNKIYNVQWVCITSYLHSYLLLLHTVFYWCWLAWRPALRKLKRIHFGSVHLPTLNFLFYGKSRLSQCMSKRDSHTMCKLSTVDFSLVSSGGFVSIVILLFLQGGIGRKRSCFFLTLHRITSICSQIIIKWKCQRCLLERSVRDRKRV